MILILNKKDEIERTDSKFGEIIEYYNDPNTRFLLEQFMNQVKNFFDLNPKLHKSPMPAIHSIKFRIKDPNHLLDKLQRKAEQGTIVTKDTLFKNITDLVGVRILHIYQEQFETIHTEIMRKVDSGDWVLSEQPRAYTWDPETQVYFKSLEISTEIKESYYTSVHYLVKPNVQSELCCEIQVRTLFEEIWGEIDHAINYPHKTGCVACSEQLKVMSRLVSTGTKLSDSIFKSYKEYQDKSNK